MADVPWSSELELLQSIEDLQQEVMECRLQISDDFEELTLLREFAESLEIAESCRNPYHVAERILPALCRGVKAEAVVLVVTGDGPGSDATLTWSGPQTIDRETVLCLVDRFGAMAAGQPVVRNHFQRDNPPEFPGLRELVLVHVVKGDHLLGWLLALNRSVPQELPGDASPPVAADTEFGTGQATLLGSVATMIAGHARNVEQFQQKERLLVNMVRALVSAIEAKDEYTCGHSERVALYSACLGRGLGLSEPDCERLYLTGLYMTSVKSASGTRRSASKLSFLTKSLRRSSSILIWAGPYCTTSKSLAVCSLGSSTTMNGSMAVVIPPDSLARIFHVTAGSWRLPTRTTP